MAGFARRGSCWLLLAGLLAFVWAVPLLTPWEEHPQIFQPARAQAAWIYAWLVLFTWLPFQAAALGRRLRSQGQLEFLRARGTPLSVLYFQICASVMVWMFAVVLLASIICVTVCMPKNPEEARLWFNLVVQYAALYSVAAAPLLLLAVALGTCAGEVIAFLLPVFLLFFGFVAATWMEPLLAGSEAVLYRSAWLALPHYHLADLTPRLVFKMGPLAQADFIDSFVCLALQGAAISFVGRCLFRTRF